MIRLKFKEIPLKETILQIKSCYQYSFDNNYVKWYAATTPPRGKRVTKLLLDLFPKKSRILDVGCSLGLTLGYTAQVFPNIQGIDTDEKAVKIARERE